MDFTHLIKITQMKGGNFHIFSRMEVTVSAVYIITSTKFWYHSHADDTQLNITLSPGDNETIQALSRYIKQMIA